jgi:acetyl-CoA C-acetyltransferase
MIRDGLWCAFDDCHMGNTAENIAREYEVSREDQDAFAASSQQKAEAAMKSGRFQDEIIGVPVQRKKETILIDTDEHPRPGNAALSLGRKPASNSATSTSSS